MNSSVADSLTVSPALKVLPIERRSSADLSFRAFVEEYVNRNRPVIITNAVSHWDALGKWTPEFFKSNFGSQVVQASYNTRMALGEVIDSVNASTKENPGVYLHRVIIQKDMPALLPDITPGNPYGFPERYSSPIMPRHWRRPDGFLKLLIGGVGGKFPLMHFDSDNSNAMITETYGAKEFVLFAPKDSPFVYPSPEPTSPVSSVDNIDMPDVDRFPLFVNATQYRGTITPGDAAFIPSRWWHAARVVRTSISTCTNMIHRANWNGFVNEACSAASGGRAVSIAKRVYLHSIGGVLNTCETLQERYPGSALARSASALAPQVPTNTPTP
jgi:hypothetical protein